MSYRLLRMLTIALACFAAVLIPGRASAGKSNFDLFVYRRCYTPNERVSLRLSVYNEKAVDFSAYPIDLRTVAPTSKSLEQMKGRIAAVDLSRLHPAASWRYRVGSSYPDQWAEDEVRAPKLMPGVYLVRARSGGVEKRTWLAVTDIALVTKRSRQELYVYAVNARTGMPQSNLALGLYDTKGSRGSGVTDANGIWHSRQSPDGNLWLNNGRAAMPAFLLTGVPAPPEPYAVHISTDRPIYRPANTVQYRGTIRERLESEVPGGFALRPYAGKKATIEIRDTTDALIARQDVTANRFGSFEGSLQLATEPPLGRWQIVVVIGKFRSYGGFDVQEYRKPEYTVSVQFPAKYQLGGTKVPVTIEAHYFFGQPVVGAAVAYRISFSPESSNGGGEVEPPYDGQSVLGADGRFSLEIPTKRLPSNRRLNVSASVTDLSRRTQQAGESMLITGGQFQVTLETDRYMYRIGQPMTVTVTALDYDQKPVSTHVQVRLIEVKFDSRHRPYKAIVTREVATNAAGKGTVTFTPARPGNLQLEAEAFDGDHDKITAEISVWVAGNEDAEIDYPTLNLITDRQSYRPGDTASILINTSLITKHKAAKMPKDRDSDPSEPADSPGRERGYAIVTIEGERIYSCRTIVLTSKSTSISIPIKDAYFPSVPVSVLIVMDKHIYEQEASLSVERDEDRLHVTVQPSKSKFMPGETAAYTVTTNDYRGRPVSAEVALGVVDASIYAVQADNTPDLFSTFYSGQEVRVQTDFSFAAQYSGGGVQAMRKPEEQAKRKDAQAIRVRKQFADTAYWNASVVTDATGSAQVSFTLPDNLTTWRATARGITSSTQVGAVTNDVISTMPLTVRLELPRFYVAGDEAVVSAIVHNGTDGTREVKTSIEAAGAQLTGEAKQTLTMEPGKDVRLDWRAKIDPAAGTVRFLVTADGGVGAQDATELTLPKREDGLQVVEAHADEIPDVSGSTTLDLSKLPPNSSVRVTLAPSLAPAMFDALDYLQSYPYGCAEQTMSSFLPDIVVARTLRRLATNRAPRPDLDRWVSLGIQKLYRYQHGDGGWNWWEFDQTDSEMTAYVLWGLIQAREAGYLVDDQRLLRGTELLLKLMKDQKELNSRADWLLTLAYARPSAIVGPVTDAFITRSKLDTYALASLCLALSKLSSVATLPNGGAVRCAQMAKATATELEMQAVKLGTSVHWPAAVGGYTWREGDVSVTAHALRAVLSADAGSALIPGAVRWLMANRVGKGWDSTRSSAEAVLALAQVMETTKELQPDYAAVVSIDGVNAKVLKFDASNVMADAAVVTLTPEMLSGHSTLEIKKQGVGILYTNAVATGTVPSAEAVSLSHGITVRRTYSIPAIDPSHADAIASGQDIEVQTEITADANYRYALVEDPIPAGCEVDSSEYSSGTGFYVRREVRDNRVVFLLNELPKGKTTLTYRLHAEAPGVYRILPSIASLAYFPEIRGNSPPVKAKIVEK